VRANFDRDRLPVKSFSARNMFKDLVEQQFL